jgi:hypothetical protein
MTWHVATLGRLFLFYITIKIMLVFLTAKGGS